MNTIFLSTSLSLCCFLLFTVNFKNESFKGVQYSRFSINDSIQEENESIQNLNGTWQLDSVINMELLDGKYNRVEYHSTHITIALNSKTHTYIMIESDFEKKGSFSMPTNSELTLHGEGKLSSNTSFKIHEFKPTRMVMERTSGRRESYELLIFKKQND
jgi:hypothetical protein